MYEFHILSVAKEEKGDHDYQANSSQPLKYFFHEPLSHIYSSH